MELLVGEATSEAKQAAVQEEKGKNCFVVNNNGDRRHLQTPLANENQPKEKKKLEKKNNNRGGTQANRRGDDVQTPKKTIATLQLPYATTPSSKRYRLNLAEKQHENLVMVERDDVRPNDVLFGPGGDTNSFPGNCFYRKVLKANAMRYHETPFFEEKESIAKHIYNTIVKEGNGRFLIKDSQEGGCLFREAPLAAMMPKIMQACGDFVKSEKKKKKRTAAIFSRPLIKTGVPPRIIGMFCKAIVQAVLLHGCETWVVTPGMLRKLRGFHNKMARRISSLVSQRSPDDVTGTAKQTQLVNSAADTRTQSSRVIPAAEANGDEIPILSAVTTGVGTLSLTKTTPRRGLALVAQQSPLAVIAAPAPAAHPARAARTQQHLQVPPQPRDLPRAHIHEPPVHAQPPDYEFANDSSSKENTTLIPAHERDKIPYTDPLSPRPRTLFRSVLTFSEHQQLKTAYSNTTRTQATKIGPDSITYHDLQRIHTNDWLSDNLISAHFYLLARLIPSSRPSRKNAFYRSFFMTQLLGVKNIHKNDFTFEGPITRYHKKVPGKDIFQLNYLLIPIYVSRSHWCLISIHFPSKRIQAYDSLGTSRHDYLTTVLRYLGKVYNLQSPNTPFVPTQWRLIDVNPTTIPRQGNTVDCGCFVCAYAALILLGLPLNTISQPQMPNYRNWIGLSLLQRRLPYTPLYDLS